MAQVARCFGTRVAAPGAALDVFATAPLPADSRLWELPNGRIVSPHSASTSDRENTRLTDLSRANLRRSLDG